MRIIDHGTVVKSRENSDRQSCCFAGICALPTGRWFCGFRAAPLKGELSGQRAMITYSDDEGKSWSDPVAPFTPPDIDGRPGLFRMAYLTSMGGAPKPKLALATSRPSATNSAEVCDQTVVQFQCS